MLDTFTVKRPANVSKAEAMQALLKKYPTADILSFKKSGLQFVATLKVSADEEPSDSGGSDGPPSPAPESEDSGSEDDDGGDDSGGAPDFGGGGEEGGGDEIAKPPSMEESLAQIVHILKGMVGGGGPMGGGHPGMGGPPTTDVGAPPPHSTPGGPPGMAGGAPPLPPPVQKHSPMSGPAFASTKSFVATREDAHELTPKQAVAEAYSNFPGYQVAKVEIDSSKNQYKLAMVQK